MAASVFVTEPLPLARKKIVYCVCSISGIQRSRKTVSMSCLKHYFGCLVSSGKCFCLDLTWLRQATTEQKEIAGGIPNGCQWKVIIKGSSSYTHPS